MDHSAGHVQLNYCFNCMHHLDTGQTVCPACGHNNKFHGNPSVALPEGTILAGRYLVGRVLGQGGFGITYIAIDIALDIRVAIKEYFPTGVAAREQNSIRVLPVPTSSNPNGFQKGCDEFQLEAKNLARFNSPNIVRVRDYFLENGTAYIVMDYIDGSSLTEETARSGGRMPWNRVLSLFNPLILEMDKLHAQNLIHRDIKPDNMKIHRDALTGEEQLVLLDFGSARYFSGQRTQTYTALVTPGFAPIEQYNERSRQGPYTDVYSLCASMYALLTGERPPDATARAAGDAIIIPINQKGVSVPGCVENAVMHGLAAKSTDRPQTMRELYNELNVSPVIPSSKGNNEKKFRQSNKVPWIFLAAAVIVFIAGLFLFLSGNSKTPAKTVTPTPTVTPTRTPTEKKTPLPTNTPTTAGPRIYVVQEYDSCWSIITEFGVPLDLFLAINNLDFNCDIAIGQELVIPAPDQELPTATPIPLEQYRSGQLIEYEVQVNDSYQGIASKFNTTLDSIRKLNEIEDMNTFPPFGQILTIAVNLVTPTPSPVPTFTEIPYGD